MRWIIQILGLLSLKHLQQLGSLLGLMTFWFSSKDLQLIKDNLAQAQIAYAFKANPVKIAQASGTMLAESLWIWNHPQDCLKLTEVLDWQVVDQAMAEGKGLLMLTPHLGAFEMIPRVLAEHFCATIIYKPAKQAWLNQVIEKGRSHPQMHFVPANIQGVRQVARALQRGQAVGILPDQVPGEGDGVWVPFFGKLAYTAVLPAKLATKNQVPTIIFSATRKKIGLGWTIRAMRINKPFDADPSIAAEELNRAIEEVILKCPEQYLWGYNRYKQPAGAPPAPSVQS